MYIIDAKDWYKMSAVIGICGTNFCSLIADRRKVIFDNNGKHYTSDDETTKIFKVGDNTIVGVTGVFHNGVCINDAVKDIENNSVIYPAGVKRRIVAYIENKKSDIICPLNYIIGGKDIYGKFIMYEVHYDVTTGIISDNINIPKPPLMNFALSMSLPVIANLHKAEITDMVSVAIQSSKTHGEMIEKAKAVIGYISELDDTVSKNTDVINIF